MQTDEIIYDLQRQDSYVRRQNLSYLTQRSIDYELLQLNATSKPSKATKFSPDLSPTPFAHMLPMIDNVSVEKILRLREKERGSFDVYRSAVSHSLKNASDLKVKQQRELFNDVIRPEISKINASISKSKKIVKNSMGQDAAYTFGSLIIGVVAPVLHLHSGIGLEGMIPAALGGAGGAIGGVHYSKKLIKSMSSLLGDSKEALDSKYYFLWKLDKIGQN